jgi:N-acetylmuramoyl-L-alanine amidase
LSAVPIVDAEDPSGSFPGYVTAYWLNVRSGPGIAYSRTSLLLEGQPVSMVGRDVTASWVQIELPNQTLGWVSSTYINCTCMMEALPVTGGAVPNPMPEASGTVTAYTLNLRSGPGVGYGIKGWLYWGQQVTVIGADSTRVWLKVSVKPGFEGWVHSTYVATDRAVTSLPVVQP